MSLQYHPGKAIVMADAPSRKVYANNITVGELPKDLCEQFKDLRLELVPKGYLVAMEVKPTLLDTIREAQKKDSDFEEIQGNMIKGKAEGFREDEMGTLWFE
jgi:polyhydroxyalkanoate synthesis regulator phasin